MHTQKLRALLRRVRRRHAHDNQPTPMSLDSLLTWAVAGGARLHAGLVAAETKDAGLALLAREPISRGTELLRVPFGLLLTSRDAPTAFDGLGQTNRLALALLAKRRRPSSWEVPLRILPEGFDTPLFYTPEERAWLQGSPLLTWNTGRELNVERSFSSIRDQINAAVSLAADGSVSEDSSALDGLQLAEFKWALSVAWSRSFMVQLEPGGRKTAALVPVGDLWNHAETELANVDSHSDPAGRAFVFTAAQDIAAGEQCTLSYGAMGEPSNAILMLDYGFCLPYSLHDEMTLDLSPPAEQPLHRQWLQQLQLADYAQRARLTLRGEAGTQLSQLPTELLLTLRVRALDAAALGSTSPQQLLRAMPPAVDLRGVRILLSALRDSLAAYGDTLEMGERYLAQLAAGDASAASGLDASAFGRRRCAAALTVGEQRVLRHWTDVAVQIESSLERQIGPSSSTLHRFWSDSVPWDPARDASTGGSPRRCEMEVRPRDPQSRAVLEGVFVANGTCSFEPGDLVGCYTGEIVDQAARDRKKLTAPRAEDHIYPVNATHAVDPTSASTGTMADTVPPYRSEMAVVNEPTSGLPNVYPVDYEYGRCRDRYGEKGVAYYAARSIMPGDEVLVCYGTGFSRGYETTCAGAQLLGRWSALQRILLRL